MTVVCHVDDLKISHENGDTVDALISKLINLCGKEAELTIHQGKVYGYIGMKLDYHERSKVEIDMTDYLKTSWTTFQISIKARPLHRWQIIFWR